MIHGLYYVHKKGEEQIPAPFKRGDTINILWESDPSKDERETWYTLLMATSDGDTLEGKSFDDVIQETWGPWVDYEVRHARATRDKVLHDLAKVGLISTEAAERLVALSGTAYLEALEELGEEAQDDMAAIEARQDAEPTVKWEDYLAKRGESA